MGGDRIVTTEIRAEAARLYRLRCWGDFGIAAASSGADLNPRGRKARALLAYLALHPDKGISRERLAGLLWGDRGEEQARASLRQALAELRRFADGGNLLTVARDHVTLHSAALLIELDEIADIAVSGDADVLLRAMPDPELQLFANLAGLDSGFDDWLAIERARARDDLVMLAMTAAAKAGPSRAGAALAARAKALDPTCRPLPVAGSAVQSLPGGAARREAAPPIVLAILAALMLVIAGTWLVLRSRADNTPTAVAVLPFRDLSGARPYLAEGVAEEVIAQLGRNPRLKVLGRTSAWSLRDEHLDARALGNRLGVSYLIEGSVRADATRVRIDVSLVRAKDGAQLWSERYQGGLGDLFAIQDRIGASVAGRLGGNNGPGSMLRTRGDVYSLYLTARALVRDREPAKNEAAVRLLHQAVKLDPNYAPAWASLALATKFQLSGTQSNTPARVDAVRREALDYGKRALSLAPNLSEAHVAYAIARVMDHDPASYQEARNQLEHAVVLDPNNAEAWVHLSQYYGHDARFERELNALRHAVTIDPYWWRAFYFASELAWEMGEHAEALRYVRAVERGGTPQPFIALMVRGDMMWRTNDLSRGLRLAQAAYNSAEEGRRMFARWAMGRALRALGRYEDARRIWGFYPIDDTMWAMWSGHAPAAENVRRVYINPIHGWDDTVVTGFVLRTLARAKRSPEIASIYDRRFSSPDAMADAAMDEVDFIEFGPLVATAMRLQGREAEARHLFQRVAVSIDCVRAQGKVPRTFYFVAAKALALMGRPGLALSALERADSLGWLYAKANDSFPDLAMEPAFDGLTSDPRFLRVVAHQRAVIAGEREKLGAFSI